MTPTIYIICLIVGGGLLLVSAIFSGHHAGDVSLDHATPDAAFDHAPADLEHHAAADGHHAGHNGHSTPFTLASWFSIQFAIYFCAVFGLVGTTLTYASNVSSGWVLAAALATAIVAGQLVHQSMRFLRRTGRGSEISATDFLNKPARVTITIDPPRHGEVAVPLHSGERFVSATAKRTHDRFRVGDRVVVVNFSNGVAEVVSREEFDFVSGKDA